MHNPSQNLPSISPLLANQEPLVADEVPPYPHPQSSYESSLHPAVNTLSAHSRLQDT